MEKSLKNNPKIVQAVFVFLVALATSCANDHSGVTTQAALSATPQPTVDLNTTTDSECYPSSEVYRNLELPDYLQRVWPYPGCSMSLATYNRSLEYEFPQLGLRGVGVGILWVHIETLTWDTVLPPVETCTKLLVDEVEVSDNTLLTLVAPIGILVYDENGNSKLTGYNPDTLSWGPVLEPGEHTVLLQLENTQGEVFEYTWTFTITDR